MAIDEVNESHHFSGKHKPNSCTAWVQETKEERIRELRQIIINGFVQKKPKVKRRWDPSAQKWRTISEPAQWPDQYVHHALIQALQPTLMRGMDPYCCGSIRGRGTRRGKEAVERWMEKDPKGTRYEFSGDVYHFYDSLKPEVVMARMRQLFKDRRVLDLIWRIVKDGVLIGAYPSQWFANTVLQPLDQLIRQSGLCAHYVRYMDNLTATGPNKRKLKKLRYLVDGWLNDHDLRLKGDWQIFRIVGKTAKKPLEAPRRGFERPKRRMPDAMGYRYGRGVHHTTKAQPSPPETGYRAIPQAERRREAGSFPHGEQHHIALRPNQALQQCEPVPDFIQGRAHFAGAKENRPGETTKGEPDMDYVFGTEGEIEVLKTKGGTHSDLTGYQQIVQEFPGEKITDNFRVVKKTGSAEDGEGNCYDWYEIDRHYRTIDKSGAVAERVGAIEAAIERGLNL